MSVDREDFKVSGSFINPQDLTFILWKYQPEDRTQHSAEKGRG